MKSYCVKMIAAGLVAGATLALPADSAAQRYGYEDDEPSVVVECGAGQRAVMQQRRVNGRTQVVARCERSSARAASSQYEARRPERTKTKTALTIAGSAATGAGVGGALKGKKGALVGAAIAGGAASIYEAAKRR